MHAGLEGLVITSCDTNSSDLKKKFADVVSALCSVLRFKKMDKFKKRIDLKKDTSCGRRCRVRICIPCITAAAAIAAAAISTCTVHCHRNSCYDRIYLYGTRIRRGGQSSVRMIIRILIICPTLQKKKKKRKIIIYKVVETDVRSYTIVYTRTTHRITNNIYFLNKLLFKYIELLQ